MKKFGPENLPKHDRAQESSAYLCDRLFHSLTEKIALLSRSKSSGCCGFSSEGGAKFAYIYHNLKGAKLDVWFVGDKAQINLFPGLNIRPRSDTKSGWKKFNHRFSFENDSQTQMVSDLLFSTIKVSNLSQLPQKERRLFPDEVDQADSVRCLAEGALSRVSVNAYERNEEARRRCIQHHKARCFICKFDFAEHYGEYMEGFIHVHHLRPIAEIGKEYIVDPINDLCPVCPNCHAVLHHRNPQLTIYDVKSLLTGYQGKKKAKRSGIS